MKETGDKKWSLYATVFCMIVMCYTSFFFYPRYKQLGTESVISYDVSGYYWYLPSMFIYHDLKHQSFKDNILSKYSPTADMEFLQGYKLPNGNYVMKYAAGMAVMYLPFFAVAHAVAAPLGYPADGFSLPYQLAIQVGGLLVGLLGLWYFRRLMLRFYEDRVVALVVLILILGTNYLNYSAIDAGMSHTWLFTIYVFILSNTILLHETFKVKYAVRVGLLIGLATLTRPTEVISCLIPVLWGMERISFAGITAQFKLLLSKSTLLFVAIVCAAAVISLQFIYWKYVSGKWIVYSYGDQHLYFRSPNILDYTFSYRSGWLLYTPMLLLAFAGLISFWLKGRNKVALTTFFLLNYYIVCAWSIWWYGGRAMVQSYPVLMFPVASLITAAFSRRLLLWALAPVILFFTYLNTWFLYQSHGGGLYDVECMSGPYYWRVVGRWNVPAESVLLKDGAELYDGTPGNIHVLWENNFDQDTSVHSSLPPIQGTKSLELNEHTPYTREYKFAYSGKPQWIRAEADFRCKQSQYNTWKMAQLIVRAYKGGAVQKGNMIRVHRMLSDGDTKRISLSMNTQGLTIDSIGVGFWNGGDNRPLLIDNVSVSSFDIGK